jgi:hypothetical protein
VVCWPRRGITVLASAALRKSILQRTIMAPPHGQATYKKKDGIISLTNDEKLVTWTPLPGNGPPVVSVAVSNITSKQPVAYSSLSCSLVLTHGAQICNRHLTPTQG